jgi:hypothetical protein
MGGWWKEAAERDAIEPEEGTVRRTSSLSFKASADGLEVRPTTALQTAADVPRGA